MLVRQLVDQLRSRGFETDRVALPFKWYPRDEILAHAAAWRLLDLTESNSRPVDLVIGTKFPSYFARHPRKVCWLVHQHRAAYELAGTVYSDFGHDERDVGTQERLLQLDEQMLGECVGRYTISRTVTDRLRRFNGLESTPLYHPPLLGPRLQPGRSGDYVLSVARLEGNKRIDLIVRAMALAPEEISLVIVGQGSHRDRIQEAAEETGVAHRIRFAGPVPDETLVGLYREALALVYVPFDEDYGLATLEAFLAAKPVITAQDSGGTLEFVQHEVNGLVCGATPEEVGAAIARLAGDRPLARGLGDAGRQLAAAITWDSVIDRLVSHG